MNMSGLESSLLSRALFGMVTVGFNKLKTRIARLDAVEQAFEDAPAKRDAAVTTALADISTIVGRNGLLTDHVAAFFDDLSTTGLADRIALIAASDTPGHGALAAFKQLCRRHSEIFKLLKADDAEALFKILVKMFRASLFNNQKASEYFSRQTLSTIIELGIQLDRGLLSKFAPRDTSGKPLSNADLESLHPWLRPRQDEIAQAISALATATKEHFSLIRVEGPSKKAWELEAEKIYVGSKLREVRYWAENQQESKQQITIDDFLHGLDRAVIVGDPGGGKTTTVRMICRDLNRQAIQGQGPLPIFVTLRKYFAALARDQTLSLLDFIIREFAQKVNDWTTEALRLPLQNILEFGNALVVFDGLDEIVSVAQRRDVTASVRQFCAQYPLSRFIVTSRKTDYRHVAIAGMPVFELAPFQDEQIIEYVRLSSLNVFFRSPVEVDAETARFMVEVDRSAHEFKGNPLLLSLIVWLFNSTNRIPDNRAEIYRECSLMLFQRWDALREISAEVPDAHRLFALLAHLANEMYLQPALMAGARRNQLEEIIQRFFLNHYSVDAPTRAAFAAEKFVEHLAGRAWVLRALGTDTYEFTHRTFLEYFFANYLNDKHLSPDDLCDALAPKILAGEWNVPSHLALQMCAAGGWNRSEKIVAKLLQLYEQSSDRQRRVMVGFIGEATEYLQPSEPSLERISKIITLEIQDNVEWRRIFVSVMRTSNDMRNAIYRGLGQGLAELVTQSRTDKISFILDWFKATTIISEYSLDVSPKGMGLPNDALPMLAEEVLESLQRTEPTSPASLKARFDVSGEFDAIRAAEFNVRLWQSSSEGPLSRLDWRTIDFRAMVDHFTDLLAGRAELSSLKYARLAIEIARGDLKLRTPVAITRARVVIPRNQTAINSNLLLQRKHVPADVAAGICFALFAYEEVCAIGYSGRWQVPSVPEIYKNWRTELDPDYINLGLFDLLIANRVSLFQSMPTDYTTMYLEDVFQFYGAF